MTEKISVSGTILKATKLWFIKINTKAVRANLLDGATFPYSLQVRYNANGNQFEKVKVVYWRKEIPQVGDTVCVLCNAKKPTKIYKVTKQT